MTKQQKQDIIEYYSQPHEIIVNDYALPKGVMSDKLGLFYVFMRNPQSNVGFEADIWADNESEAWELFKLQLDNQYNS